MKSIEGDHSVLGTKTPTVRTQVQNKRASFGILTLKMPSVIATEDA